MVKEKLSEVGIRFYQILNILGILLLTVAIIKVISFRNITFSELCFLTLVALVFTFVIIITLSIKEVNLHDDKIISSNIFQKKVRPISHVESVEETIIMNYYVIMLKNNQKIYFKINPEFVNLSLTEPRITYSLKILKEKLRLNANS